MSLYSIHHVGPRTMVPLARVLSWLPDIRPVLARRAILDRVLGQACLEDPQPVKGLMGDEYLTVVPAAFSSGCHRLIRRQWKRGY